MRKNDEFADARGGRSAGETIGAWVGLNVRIRPPRPAAPGDFRLAPDSPAFDLGFEPIKMSGIGVRDGHQPR